MNSFHASISAGAGGGDRDGDKFQRHPSLGQLQMQLQEVSAGFEPPTFLIPTMNQKWLKALESQTLRLTHISHTD